MNRYIFLLLVACGGDGFRVDVTTEKIQEQLPLWTDKLNQAYGGMLIGEGKPVTIKVEPPVNPKFGGYTVCNKTACQIQIKPTIYHPLDAAVIHELGHAMGLKHTEPIPNYENIMDPWSAWFLTLDQIAGQIADQCRIQGCHPIDVRVE